MNIKRNIIFALESRKKNGVPIIDNVPIRMSVVYAGKRVEFTTGYRIDIAKWDNDKQRVKSGCTNKLKQSSYEINAELLKYYTEIHNIFKEFEVHEIVPTPKQLKDEFNFRVRSLVESKEDVKVNIFNVFDQFTRECSTNNKWSDSTYKKFSTVKNHLKDFCNNLSFDVFTEKGLNEYVDFLCKEKDMRNSTVFRHVKFLKTFLKWGLNKGYHNNISYEKFKLKLKNIPNKVVFLTFDELDKLKKYEIPRNKQYLERVRDVFLFCCFSGLRYSDVRNLKRSNVKSDHIEVTTIKTADNLIIELNNQSKAILEKYKDINLDEHRALPVISNQKMNNYLKELGELVGINDPMNETYYKGNRRMSNIVPKYALLGTHVGRRTFICNALALGIPAQVVMKWTGHSDYKAMKPYIDVADKTKANAMNKFNNI